jgi:hypothetical protein
MRYDSSFQRTDEVVVERTSCPDWLENFAEKLSVQENTNFTKTASKNAVEVSRDRNINGPSIYEMMSSIINKQKPKFSSVEEAVQEYQKRTGLSDYLKRTSSNNIQDLAKNIVEASVDCNESDEKKNNYEINLNELNDEIPSIVKEHPEIKNYINNTIDTNHGIQIPALLHSIVELFGKEGISQQIFSDQEFLKWINKIMISKNIVNKEHTPSHIGRDVGTKIDYSGDTDSNKNPFTLLETTNRFS